MDEILGDAKSLSLLEMYHLIKLPLVLFKNCIEAVRVNNKKAPMKKDVDITKSKKLMEEKLIELLSKPNLKSSELKLIEEIEQKLSAINKEISRG